MYYVIGVVGGNWLLTFLEGRNMNISYEGMSAKAALALLNVVCSAKTGGTQPASTNSDYATALKVWTVFVSSVSQDRDNYCMFAQWIHQRLHPDKRDGA